MRLATHKQLSMSVSGGRKRLQKFKTGSQKKENNNGKS
jgi:hypothetical protein